MEINQKEMVKATRPWDCHVWNQHQQQ